MTPDHVFHADYPVIYKVRRGSPAEKAGLDSGDVVLEVNGVDARTEGAIFPAVGVKQVIRIRRGDSEREVILLPIALPTRANVRRQQ
jgi:C-terminal processing protease CtpA/Prc